MQLFLFAPPVIFLIYRYEKTTLIALVLLVFGCIGCTLGVHQQYQLKSVLYVLNFIISFCSCLCCMKINFEFTFIDDFFLILAFTEILHLKCPKLILKRILDIRRG